MSWIAKVAKNFETSNFNLAQRLYDIDDDSDGKYDL